MLLSILLNVGSPHEDAHGNEEMSPQPAPTLPLLRSYSFICFRSRLEKFSCGYTLDGNTSWSWHWERETAPSCSAEPACAVLLQANTWQRTLQLSRHGSQQSACSPSLVFLLVDSIKCATEVEALGSPRGPHIASVNAMHTHRNKPFLTAPRLSSMKSKCFSHKCSP